MLQNHNQKAILLKNSEEGKKGRDVSQNEIKICFCISIMVKVTACTCISIYNAKGGQGVDSDMLFLKTAIKTHC